MELHRVSTILLTGWGTSLMRPESTLFLDPLLEPPAVPPIALPFDWSHWRNYIVLGSDSFFFSLSSFVQRNGDIRCRYVALIAIVPTDACPAISFVFFHYSQYLPLLHSNGPFTGTLITEKMHYWRNQIYIHTPADTWDRPPSDDIPGKLYMAVHFPMGAASSSSSKSSSNSA